MEDSSCYGDGFGQNNRLQLNKKTVILPLYNLKLKRIVDSYEVNRRHDLMTNVRIPLTR